MKVLSTLDAPEMRQVRMAVSMFTDGLSFITETTLNLDSSPELKNIINQVAILTLINRFES
ncbi:conserved hypothetical protein [Vibrio harveyi]|nr:conserved hypothetical protein [Vibrio harveyi]